MLVCNMINVFSELTVSWREAIMVSAKQSLSHSLQEPSPHQGHGAVDGWTGEAGRPLGQQSKRKQEEGGQGGMPRVKPLAGKKSRGILMTLNDFFFPSYMTVPEQRRVASRLGTIARQIKPKSHDQAPQNTYTMSLYNSFMPLLPTCYVQFLLAFLFCFPFFSFCRITEQQ